MQKAIKGICYQISLVLSEERLLHNGISMAHNGAWLFVKLRKWYTVIDIGVTTMHIGKNIWIAVWHEKELQQEYGEPVIYGRFL